VRNYVVFRGFVPVQQIGGIHFYWASPPSTTKASERETIATSTAEGIQGDWTYYGKAVERVRQDPLGYLRLMGQRLVAMWYKTSSGRYEGFALLLNGPLLLLAVPGIVLSLRQGARVLHLLVFVVYYTMLHMVTIANVRYTLPMIPILLMFAMVTVDRLWSLRNRGVEDTRPPTPTG
jgi:hypothetical protein